MSKEKLSKYLAVAYMAYRLDISLDVAWAKFGEGVFVDEIWKNLATAIVFTDPPLQIGGVQ